MATLRSTLIVNILIAVIGRATVSGQRTHEPTVESCYKISEHEQRCFKSFRTYGTLWTWPAARDWCYNQSDGYTLATIRDDATQEAVIAFLYENELVSRYVWIGAKQTHNSRWIWIDGTTEQDANVQDSNYSNRSVAVIYGSSLMSSSVSREQHRYICQFEGEKCRKFANDSSRYRQGLNDNCYVAFPRINQHAALSWYKARTFCLHRGGDLARSRAVLDVTSSSWPGSYKYYVGLQKDEYVWIDTKEAVGPYNNFQGGQPSWSNQEKCAVLSYYLNFRVWEVVNCMHGRFFVCSKVKPVSGSIDPVTTTVNGTRTTAAATNQLPALSLLEVIGISVGAFVFFIVCIIITAVITCACVRGSSSKASGNHASANDYERQTADNQNKKSQKKIQKREKKIQKREEKSQKKSQKKNRNEDEADQDIGPPEPPDFSGHDPVGYEGYEFQDTNANPYPYPYDPADEPYYPSESVYNNDPQFQPPMTGYADEYQNH